ncbi:TadE/TadG family type IV pilus assembly protein [Magnetospira sp. QH-2]|uniref:TadE/TadG family type IV pilus assembly protein n=1 Tax=Magnetospira sp. (strain QH-2) TaxID=1288970 RepID=UPI0003E80ACF|nr:TadE family protein [Magnetospira sp. QH-2]CCQ74288.1 Conserved protein of unknown function. Similar to TadE-like protein from Sphingomonas sp. SKA58, swall : Q1N7Q8 [Magnetospira sp. QH-2]
MGSSAVEFALAAPILFTMAVGAIEFGVIMLASTLMESGLREAARYGITGQDPTTGTRLDRIMAIIDQRTLNLVDMAQAEVEVMVYPGFSDIGRAEGFVDGNGNGTYDAGETYNDENGNGSWDDDVGSSGAGGSGDIVVYRITYPWQVWTPLATTFIGDAGNIELGSSIVVRNEPWDTSGGGGA